MIVPAPAPVEETAPVILIAERVTPFELFTVTLPVIVWDAPFMVTPLFAM